MAEFYLLQAFASVLLTLSIFLSYPEESLSTRGIPLTFFSTKGGSYMGMLGDVSNPKIRMINSFTLKTPQWYYRKGSLKWERNSAYCLTPECNTERLMLKSCSQRTGKWEIGRKKYQPIYNSRCKQLTLTRSSDKIFMAPRQNIADQKWLSSFDLKKSLKRVPLLKYPTEDNKGSIFREVEKSLVNTFTPALDHLPFTRDVASFPGTVNSKVRRISRKIRLRSVWKTGESNLSAIMNTPEIWHPTQLYAPPGEPIKIILPSKLPISLANGIILRVGAHDNVASQGKYLRMPIVSESYLLYPGENMVRSQYGGNLIFKFATMKRLTVEVLVMKVVEAPYFKLGVTNIKMWFNVRRRDSPHTVLESRRCVIVVPKSSSRILANPENLLKKYDRNIKLADELSGFDSYDPPPPGLHWFVNEIQPVSFTGGFPTSIDRRVHNLANENTPDDKVIWEHIGTIYHQHIWVPLFGRKPLAKLFAMYIHEKILNSSMVTDSSKVYGDLKDGMTYHDVTDDEKLVFFQDLLRVASTKRWDIFRDLHRRGRNLTDFELENISNNPQYRLEFVYAVLSVSAQRDLYSLFKRWGFQINPKTREKVKAKAGSSAQDPSSNLLMGAILFVFLIAFVLNT